MAKGGKQKVNRPKQDGYTISLNSEQDTVTSVWVRFGTKDGNDNYQWDRTIALGPMAIDPNTTMTVTTIDADQLPAQPNSCYYQLLCEVQGNHGDRPTIMTEPEKLT